MPNTHSKGVLERGAAPDLWRNTLSQIPSVFGRLVYLSSLRNANTGKYEHHGLALIFGEAEADRTLRRIHSEEFATWLGYTLEPQKADLDLYLSALQSDKRSILQTWARLMPYQSLMPTNVLDVERKLYLADFAALLQLLMNEYGVSGPDQDA